MGAIPPLRFYLEKVLRDGGGGVSCIGRLRVGGWFVVGFLVWEGGFGWVLWPLSSLFFCPS